MAEWRGWLDELKHFSKPDDLGVMLTTVGALQKIGHVFDFDTSAYPYVLIIGCYAKWAKPFHSSTHEVYLPIGDDVGRRHFSSWKLNKSYNGSGEQVHASVKGVPGGLNALRSLLIKLHKITYKDAAPSGVCPECKDKHYVELLNNFYMCSTCRPQYTQKPLNASELNTLLSRMGD